MGGTRVGLLAAAVVGLCWSLARADVVVTSQTSGRGPGMDVHGETVIRVKGLRMRTDVTVRGDRLSTLVDLEAAQFVALDHQARTATVYDIRAFAEPVRAIDASAVSLRLTPRRNVRTLAGQTCREHDIDVRVSGDGAGRRPFSLRGTAWLAPEGPGLADWSRFYATVASRGLFFTDPRAARIDPGRARALTVLYAEMAAVGLPCATRFDIPGRGAAGGDGGAGGSTMTSEAMHIVVEAVPDELFAIPSGYDTRRN